MKGARHLISPNVKHGPTLTVDHIPEFSVSYMLTESRLPFSDALWGVYLSLLLVSLVVKPTPYRGLLFLPILPLTAYVLLSTTGTFNGDYYLGLGCLTMFWTASDLMVFTDVQRTLCQVPLKGAAAAPAIEEGPIEDASLWRRTRWAFALLNSPRGVGWAHEPTSALPAHPPAGTPRATFVAQRLWKAMQFFLLHDACNLHVRWNAMYRPDGAGWTADGWIWRGVVTAGWGLSAYSALMLGTSLLSAGSVACGLSEPEEWPPLFGGPREAWTIRKFWGRGWHQLMRRFVSVHGKFLAQRVLKLSPGGNPSAYVQLYTAFLLSAAVHYGAETMALRHWGGGAFVFFMLQPCAITLEDFLIFLAKNAGLRAGWWVHVMGYAWTWTWFALTLPAWQVPLVRAGLMEESLPVSLLMGVWRGEWVLQSP
ncbi:membrane bound O-acyl transferase family-domain-containing protein [Mycena vitilis]|nr:membrane bound O-acyl transferase family-domain-containing protein [Mycena vitilis]